ncbi:MAG: peptidoglycan DD-metalloendopeptidase family protein [Alphaproteobacteria bacterium]|nr:peptidoglycan DD-metalloendopeptidase family protein [Alphaproteobacteria bacterium]
MTTKSDRRSADIAASSKALFTAASKKWFVERQIFYRRNGQVSFVSITRPMQICLSLVGIAVIGWVGYTSFYFATIQEAIRAKNREVAETKIAYKSAMRQVATHNGRLLRITRSLERSQAQVMTMFNPNVRASAKTRAPESFTDLREALAAATRRRTRGSVRPGSHIRDWRELTARNATLEHGLASIGNEVQSILNDHGAVKAERNRLRDNLSRLRQQLASLRTRQDNLVTRLSDGTSSTIGEASRVIAMTGLNLDMLVGRAARLDGKTIGAGGPFKRATRAEDPLALKVAVLDSRIERWRYLRAVFRRLPLTAPLEHYRMSSHFGMRRDPMTKRWANHNGMDFAYHLNTPVLATAPGKVVFAGWRGGFGWLVEIDHGLGLRTRYAHLRQILVKRGAEVTHRHKIGLLGTSGRSNGPHVHYEILIDGKPVDPKKFIKAGKYVFKG